jgi:hypothetical protein
MMRSRWATDTPNMSAICASFSLSTVTRNRFRVNVWIVIGSSDPVSPAADQAGEANCPASLTLIAQVASVIQPQVALKPLRLA